MICTGYWLKARMGEDLEIFISSWCWSWRGHVITSLDFCDISHTLFLLLPIAEKSSRIRIIMHQANQKKFQIKLSSIMCRRAFFRIVDLPQTFLRAPHFQPTRYTRGILTSQYFVSASSLCYLCCINLKVFNHCFSLPFSRTTSQTDSSGILESVMHD